VAPPGAGYFRFVADRALDLRALKDVLAKNDYGPTVKEMAADMIVTPGLSERRVCGLVEITRCNFRRPRRIATQNYASGCEC
jgi:hypothetical protein